MYIGFNGHFICPLDIYDCPMDPMDYVYEMSIGLFNMSIGHLAEVLDINRNLNFLSKTFNVSVQNGLFTTRSHYLVDFLNSIHICLWQVEIFNENTQCLATSSTIIVSY